MLVIVTIRSTQKACFWTTLLLSYSLVDVSARAFYDYNEIFQLLLIAGEVVADLKTSSHRTADKYLDCILLLLSLRFATIWKEILKNYFAVQFLFPLQLMF